MEDLFLLIQEAVAEGMPCLTLVDEDYGQLQTEEDTYPVTFPCVLINMEDIKWQTLAEDYQRGTASVVVRLCIDCYDDTHYTSGTAGKVADRIRMFKQLHDIIRKLEPKNALPLERQSSRWFSLPGAIKVYESTYETEMDEEPA